MGFFDFGSGKEKGTQLYFRDDRSFQFRKLPIEDNSLLLKNSASEVTMGWPMPYKVLKRFDGYKKQGAAMVLVSFRRDIIFDTHRQLTESEKPEKGSSLQKEFVRKIAEAKCYQHEKINPPFYMDKLTLFLGGTILLLALVIAFKAAFS